MLVHTRYLVNSFNITVRMPPEILTMVYSHLSTEWDVFPASQVCHHWREVLMSSPSLWTQLPCCRVSRTITSLERCKSTPIQVDFNLEKSSNAALEKVVLHGKRDQLVDPTPRHRLDTATTRDIHLPHAICGAASHTLLWDARAGGRRADGRRDLAGPPIPPRTFHFSPPCPHRQVRYPEARAPCSGRCVGRTGSHFWTCFEPPLSWRRSSSSVATPLYRKPLSVSPPPPFQTSAI